MNVTDHAVLQRDPDNRARIVLDNGKRLELPIGGPFQVGTARDVLVGGFCQANLFAST